MKDAAHHQAKFQKKELKHVAEAETSLPRTLEDSKQEERKKIKEEMKKEREEHTPEHKSEEERNKEQKRGGPVRKGNFNIH